MNKKNMVTVMCLTVGAMAFGQGKEAFMQQQAYAEMQRVSGQVDVLQSNFNELQRRVGSLEGGGGETKSLRQEIETLKIAVAELRKALQNQRAEIVNDLSGRLAKIQQQQPPAPRRVVEKRVVAPHIEYTVASGDTLSLIAQAFNTTVSKIKEMNNLKSDALRVGQKLNLPK